PGGAGGGHGRIDLISGGKVDVPGDGAGGGIEDLAAARRLCRRSCPWLSVDPVGNALCHAVVVPSFTSCRASMRICRPSLASASLSVSGGAIRSVWPYRPPLPISRPRSLVASSIRVASGGLGFRVAGSTR